MLKLLKTIRITGLVIMITATLVGSFIDAMVNDILPKRGITFNTNNTGISMEPTMKAGALFVMDEQFPFSLNGV